MSKESSRPLKVGRGGIPATITHENEGDGVGSHKSTLSQLVEKRYDKEE